MIHMGRTFIGAFLAVSLCALASAQNSPGSGVPLDGEQLRESARLDLSKAQVKEISPGVYDLRGIRMIKADRSVSFPAEVNLIDAPMEYFLVTNYGASHESIFRTNIQPIDLHIAMLLLGAKGAVRDGKNPVSTEKSRNPSESPITGDKVEITVSWQRENLGLSLRASSVALTTLTGKKETLEIGKWIYNGSELNDGIFIAQIHGDIVSLISNEFALINYVGAGAENDDIWLANRALLPPVGQGVTITVRLIQARQDESSKSGK